MYLWGADHCDEVLNHQMADALAHATINEANRGGTVAS